MTNNHPYKKYESLEVWKVLSKGLADLEANGDIQQTTASPYIIGYLSKLLDDSNLLNKPGGGPLAKPLSFKSSTRKKTGLGPTKGYIVTGKKKVKGKGKQRT